VRVIPQTLPGLVERIEAGDLEGAETQRIVRAGVGPLIAQGADTLVLACTHYPFVIPAISQAAGPDVQVIDPSPAIARQTSRLLDDRRLRSDNAGQGEVTYLTSGDPPQLREMALRLIGEPGAAQRATWDAAGERLSLAT
jgi:glutamate racemase